MPKDNPPHTPNPPQPPQPPQPRKTDENGAVVIKKYANRRLYNTGSSVYVTLDDVAEMVRQEQEFVVRDAKSGEDITCAILTQIILEEQSRCGQNLLPASFLKQIIRFYGEQMSFLLLPQYLEMTMDNFQNNQQRIQNQLQDIFGNIFDMNHISEMNKKNSEFLQSAMRAFNPFIPSTDSLPPDSPAHSPIGASSDDEQNIEELQKQIQDLQARLQNLQKN